jgi:hypothetical protein
MGLFKKRIKVRTHKAYFIGENKDPYIFITVTNPFNNRNVVVTHVYHANGYYPINKMTPLPVTIEPLQKWETWFKIKDIPSECKTQYGESSLYNGWKVRTSRDNTYSSKIDDNVPPLGIIPDGKKR